MLFSMKSVYRGGMHRRPHRPNDKVRTGGLFGCSLQFYLFGRTRLCEALLYDFSEHLFDIEACCTHLLGDEAGGRHAWCGVDLE